MKPRNLLAIAMIAMFASASRGDTLHTFSLDVSSWQEKPKSIHVAGDFNGWNKEATPLVKKGNVWSAGVKLTDGQHAYKFVADKERWLTDPKADPKLDAEDGNGGKNSVVIVGPGAPAGAATGAPAAAVPANAHVFRLDTAGWVDQPKTVNVAGEFNSWNKEALPMTKKGTVWTAAVVIPDGITHYKFVLDGANFIPDPKGDPAFDIDDTFGGHNSGVLIGPDARKLPAPKPNHVELQGVRFDPKDAADLNVVSDSEVRVRIRVQANDVENVSVNVAAEDGDAGPASPLHKIGTSLGYDSYGGSVKVPADQAGKKARLSFTLSDGTDKTNWPAARFRSPTKIADAQYVIDLTPTFTTPAWSQEAVWYQIFPERFRNGDPSNDPDNGPNTTKVAWTSKWFDAQPGEAPGADNFYNGKGNVWKRRYGGDIQGVQQALPYLKKLGVTAIYFNPVFEAESMHKYDTTDYRHIDDNFGVKGDWPVAGETADPATWKWSASDKVFLDFIAEAHKSGIKVVIDGVFNHVGKTNPFFQDVLANGKNSPYADWFEITDWGDPANWHKMADPYTVHGKPGANGIQWMGWFGNKNSDLPIFKKNGDTGMGPGPTKLIDDITVRWLAPDGDPSRGVDGFRLDAANDVPHAFWVRWRELVKKTKPDAYIAGEIWDPAQAWINDGKQFDAVMNYQFAMPAQAFFVNQKKATTPSQFLSRLTEVVYMYPGQSSLAMMNLFDSHDTDRFASMFVNPDLSYDGANRRQDESGKTYSERKPNAVERLRMLQAVACQMTYLGSPMIYYGDEAGMWSSDDPNDRQPMTWPEMKFEDPQVGFDQSIFDEYQKLIALRTKLPALKTGDFFPIGASDADGTLVYARRLGEQTVYVALNRSATGHTVKIADPIGPKGAKWVEQLTGKAVSGGNTLSIDLKPYGYAVIATQP